MANRRPTVNMESHNGLRGVAAVWVVLFHGIIYSKHSFDIQGSSLMPLFYMLSGFALAVVYGCRPIKASMGLCTKASSPVIMGQHTVANEDCERFDWKGYYFNRFIRVMPLYYLCNLIALPIFILSHTSKLVLIRQALATFIFPPAVSLTACNALDGPAWTVSTLIFFYIFFPWCVSRAQRLSDKVLVRGIVIFFYLHLVFVMGIFLGLFGLWGGYEALCLSTMDPLTQFPVFVMGVNAGILCLRHPTDQLLPWPKRFYVFPYWGSSDADAMPTSSEEEEGRWRKKSDWTAVVLLAMTMFFALGSFLRLVLPSDKAYLLGSVTLQAILPFLQLQVVVALTRDGGKSLTSRALRTQWARFLGKISASLYLVHFPIMEYLTYGVQGLWPEETSPAPTALRLVPVLLAVSIVAAYILHIGFEEPIRRRFKISPAKQVKPAHDCKPAVPVAPVIEPAKGEEMKEEALV